MTTLLRTILRSKIDTSPRTIDELAADTGLARGTIYQWLSGKRVPEAVNLRLLLVALEENPDDPETWEAWKQAWQAEAAARIATTPDQPEAA